MPLLGAVAFYEVVGTSPVYMSRLAANVPGEPGQQVQQMFHHVSVRGRVGLTTVEAVAGGGAVKRFWRASSNDVFAPPGVVSPRPIHPVFATGS